MAKHLRFNYMTAEIDCNEKRRAQVIMKDLGITYQHSTPQSGGCMRSVLLAYNYQLSTELPSKTDVYNVLVAGGFYLPPLPRRTKK